MRCACITECACATACQRPGKHRPRSRRSRLHATACQRPGKHRPRSRRSHLHATACHRPGKPQACNSAVAFMQKHRNDRASPGLAGVQSPSTNSMATAGQVPASHGAVAFMQKHSNDQASTSLAAAQSPSFARVLRLCRSPTAGRVHVDRANSNTLACSRPVPLRST